ncbi:MAG: hypothetical protein H6718_00055 [Polyangiaceae bacterium]|nr:hypothetical protein [Polyangiaceae bacterium]
MKSLRGTIIYRLCGVLASSIMLASAILKAIEPYHAVHAIKWTMLPIQYRLILVNAVSSIESVLAMAMLVFYWIPAVYKCTLGTCLLLLCFHVVSLATGVGHCGCFGSPIIPDWLTIVALVTLAGGSFICLIEYGLNGDRVSGLRRDRFMAMALVALSAALPWLVAERWGVKPDTEQVLLDIAGVVRSPIDEAIFIVGTFDCEHCIDALRKLAREREKPGKLARMHVFFVTPAGSKAGAHNEFSWLKFVRVRDALWWGLARYSLPTFIWYRRGHALEVGGFGSGVWRN